MTKVVMIRVCNGLYNKILEEQERLREQEKKKVKSRKKIITMVNASQSIARKLK